jgi:hypothetical protein
VKGMPKGMRIFTARGSLRKEEEEAWGLHNEGMEQYLAGRFPQAAASFRDALKILPDDQAAQARLAECKRLEQNPPSGAWDGVDQ